MSNIENNGSPVVVTALEIKIKTSSIRKYFILLKLFDMPILQFDIMNITRINIIIRPGNIAFIKLMLIKLIIISLTLGSRL